MGSRSFLRIAFFTLTMKKVLIVYGTRYGTTQNTSEKLQDILAAKDIDVNLVNLEDNEPALTALP